MPPFYPFPVPRMAECCGMEMIECDICGGEKCPMCGGGTCECAEEEEAAEDTLEEI